MRRARRSSGATQPSLEEVRQLIEKRLFIGRVPPKTTEADLRDTFSPFGRLTEVRNVEARGVAFIGFETWAAAHSALAAVDGKQVFRGGGQAQVASFAERSSYRGTEQAAALAKGMDNSRIFVGGLPEDLDSRDLEGLFQPFGRITGSKLLPAKGSKRCGYVTFELWGEALDAIENMDRQRYPGSRDEEPLKVVLAEPRGEDDSGQDWHDDGGGWDWDQPDRKRRRTDSGPGPGYAAEGAITFMDGPQKNEFDRLKVRYLVALDGNEPEDVVTQLHWSLMALRDAVLRGGGHGGGAAASPSGRGAPYARTGPAGAAPSPRGGGQRELPRGVQDAAPDARDANRLFIGGLPRESVAEELQALVEQLDFSCPPEEAQLLECRVLEGRGIGFLKFGSRRAAQEALDALDERQVNGWSQLLRARWAQPKGAGGGGCEEAADVRAPAARLREASQGSGAHRWSDRRQANGADDGRGAPHGRDDDGVDKKRLFVGQLVSNVDQGALRHEFERHGDVEEFRVIAEKGVAYVTYAREREAAKARKELDGRHVPGLSRGDGLNVQPARASRR